MNLDVRSESRHSKRSSNIVDKDTPRMTSTKERPRGRRSSQRSQVYSRERNEAREDSRKLCNPDDRDQAVKSDRRRTSGYHSMNASSVEASRGSHGKQSREVVISSESEDEQCRRKSVSKHKSKSRDEDRRDEPRIPQRHRKKVIDHKTRESHRYSHSNDREFERNRQSRDDTVTKKSGHRIPVDTRKPKSDYRLPSKTKINKYRRKNDSDQSEDSDSDDNRYRRIGSRNKRDVIKLGTFDGTSSSQPLEMFLGQLNNAAEFNDWTFRESLAHLKASLRGSAAQLLWESPNHCFTYAELVEKLKQRFGSSNQSAQFKSQLKARRRGKTETLQSLYTDVCRLLSLAYPNQFDMTTTQEIGIDSFLEAIDDPQLERRVRDRDFTSLDETFRYCLKLEAFDKAISMRVDPKREPIHPARAVQSNPTLEQIQLQLNHLIQKVELQNKEIKMELLANKLHNETKIKEVVETICRETNMPGVSAVNETVQEPNQTRYRSNVRCYNCNRFGHISRECRAPRRPLVEEIQYNGNENSAMNSYEQLA